MLPSAVHSVNATSPTRRGSTQCAPRAYRGGTGVPKGRLAVQRDKLPLQAGQHRPGEPGADVPGIAQPAVVGNAQDQRSDRAGAATLAGLPAADDGLLVPDVLDLDPVPPLARMVEGGQRLADHTPFRPCLRLAATTASASSRYPRRRADRVGVKAEVLQPGPALGVGQAQQRVLAVIQQVEQVQVHCRAFDQPRGGPPHVHSGRRDIFFALHIDAPPRIYQVQAAVETPQP